MQALISYFSSPKHFKIKMVTNFAGFKSEDILDNINDKNFSNFTMVSWIKLVVQFKKTFEFNLKMKR